MSVKSAPPLTNGNISPWWVCPPDRELALRAKIRTGYSTIGGRVRNDNKTFMKVEPPKQDIQPHSARSFHSSLRMSPSLYRRLSSIQTQKKNNSCKHCDCGGMVSESNLSDQEIEAIKKVVARAEAMDKADAIRIGCLIVQFQELRERCSGNGTSKCILCNDDLTLGKNALIETCDYCEKAVCTRCRVQVDAKLASGQPVICCKVCAEEQELWRRSGAWVTMDSPKVAIPDDELRGHLAEIERSKTPQFSRGYSMIDAPVGESVRSPSICSELSDGDLDISNALLKFSFPRPGSSNAMDDEETYSGTRSPLEMLSPSPTFGRTTHTMFDEVEETSLTGLDDLLRTKTMEGRREGSPQFGQGFNRPQKSSIKRTGAVRKSRKSKPPQSKTMPPDMKYGTKPEMLYKLWENQEEPSSPEAQQETTIHRSSKFRQSDGGGRVGKSRLRHVTTPERDGELSHSSESLDSSSDSELGEPLVITSTPSDSANKIIGVVPDIVVQEPAEPSILQSVEAEDTWSTGDVDKSTGLEVEQHDTMTQEPDQEEEQEQPRYHRPRSYAVLTQPGSSPILERRRMYVSSDDEGRASSRERNVVKRRKRKTSGGVAKDSGSSDEESSFLEKAHALEGHSNASKESTPHLSHEAASYPSPTTAVDGGLSPFPVSSDAVAEQSTSLSPEAFLPVVVPPEAPSSPEQDLNLSLDATPPSTSITQNGSDKCLHDAPEKASAVVDKNINSDTVVSVTPSSTTTERKEEFSLDSTPYHAFSESLTRTENIGASVANGEGRSLPPHDSVGDSLVKKEVENVVEAAPQHSVEEVSPPEVASVGQAKNNSAEELSDSLPRSTSLANGKERYQFRRRGATRLTHKPRDSSPSKEDDSSSITKQDKAKMAASRIRSDARHISSVRERHQNDGGLDLSEEMLPYSGSSDFYQKDEDEEEDHQITQRRRRDRVRNARPVQRREGRLSSSRRRQYEQQDHSDL